MTIIIVGAMGNIGRRLMAAFPGAVGIDRVAGADIVAALSDIDYAAPAVKAAFEKADGLIHVATSANVEDPDAVHWQAVTDTARLLAACDRYGIRRVVIPSSDWADPKTRWAAHNQNAYGHSKRVFEAMAHMYNVGHADRHCVALRIGWVARHPDEVAGADAWLQANYWDDARLIGQMKAALGE
ncbi:MAG: NAD(P)-dependent oxidoreductase [Hyphomicrobiales bacterium]|nr:MAG: NAD(P)-dependent oxidoreductase [Hyphomicrobiales bacterium]